MQSHVTLSFVQKKSLYLEGENLSLNASLNILQLEFENKTIKRQQCKSQIPILKV